MQLEPKNEPDLPANVIDQMIRESQPMKITNFFVERPCSAMGGGFFILLVLSIIAILLEYYLVDDGASGRDYLIWNDPIVLEYTKWQAATQFAEDNAPFKAEPERSKTGS